MSKLAFSALGKTLIPPVIRWTGSNALLRISFMDYTLAMTAVVLFSLHFQAVQAAAPLPEKAPLKDLTTLSLEELLNIRVTSATKSSTRLSDAPAAIYVLTNEDIQRTGATTIPEALRVVPGLHVARIDANKWVVSARGFNGQFANKLLVLVDGRSVYTPLFSGVWWDQQDVMMEDIERIEVIRGPGASLWGANAVNGVINIITKNARDTQGALLSAHAGNARRGGGVRYGAKLGDDAYLKVYGRYSRHDESSTQGGNEDGNDHGHLKKFGFRYDKELATQSKLMFQGDIFEGYSGGASRNFANLTADGTPVLTPPYSIVSPTGQEFSGHHVLGRWEHTIDKNSEMSLQFYWDRNQRILSALNGVDQVDTLDIDFQHSFNLTERQHITWAMGYRRNYNDSKDSFTFMFCPDKRTDDIYSLFVQDEIILMPDRWKLTLGSKIQHNPSTGYETQPNARLLWTPDARHSVWASVSRAVRIPSWVEQDVRYSERTVPPFTAPNSSPFPLIVVSEGNPELDSEKLMAYELGWRGLMTPTISADVALFYFDYSNAVSLVPGAPEIAGTFPGLFLRQPIYFSNQATAQSYGGELGLGWQVSDSWKLRANYSYFEADFNLNDNAPAGTLIYLKGSSPRHQAMLWSTHQLPHGVNLDLNMRYVGRVDTQYAPGGYIALDARIVWKPEKNMEFALVGRNVLNGNHFESGNEPFSVPTENPREVFFTAKWEF